MTFEIDVAPEVNSKVEEMKGIKNPFITLANLELLCRGNEELELCLRAIIRLSLLYTETVCRMEQIAIAGGSHGRISEQGKIHDSVINEINTFSRTLKKHGKNGSWIDQISIGMRAAYGKFAILLAFEVVTRSQTVGGQND